MLEGVDLIDWSQVDSAYGAATDFPAALRALTSPDRHLRQRAWSVLGSKVEHQDTLFPAAVVVIPFLLELLADAIVPDREDILDFLAFISSRCPARAAVPTAEEVAARFQRYQQYDQQTRQPLARADHEFADLYEHAVTIPIGIHEALRAGLPRYLQWMETHRDPSVRWRAVELVGRFVEDQATSLPRLRAQFATETDDDVRTALLETIGSLASDPTTDLEAVLALAQSPADPAVRLQAAVLVTHWLRADTPDEIVAWLHDVAEADLPAEAALVGTAYENVLTAQHALVNLGADRGIPQLLAVLQQLEDRRTPLPPGRALSDLPFDAKVVVLRHQMEAERHIPLVEDILDLAFEGKHWESAVPNWTSSNSGRYYNLKDYPPELPVTRLSTDRQREVLAALVAMDRLWDYHDDIYALYGLPTTREGLRALLANSETTPDTE